MTDYSDSDFDIPMTTPTPQSAEEAKALADSILEGYITQLKDKEKAISKKYDDQISVLRKKLSDDISELEAKKSEELSGIESEFTKLNVKRKKKSKSLLTEKGDSIKKVKLKPEQIKEELKKIMPINERISLTLILDKLNITRAKFTKFADSHASFIAKEGKLISTRYFRLQD